eukprot:6177056-Pleurochrysis_carterae.AAC.1
MLAQFEQGDSFVENLIGEAVGHLVARANIKVRFDSDVELALAKIVLSALVNVQSSSRRRRDQRGLFNCRAIVYEQASGPAVELGANDQHCQQQSQLRKTGGDFEKFGAPV